MAEVGMEKNWEPDVYNRLIHGSAAILVITGHRIQPTEALSKTRIRVFCPMGIHETEVRRVDLHRSGVSGVDSRVAHSKQGFPNLSASERKLQTLEIGSTEARVRFSAY